MIATRFIIHLSNQRCRLGFQCVQGSLVSRLAIGVVGCEQHLGIVERCALGRQLHSYCRDERQHLRASCGDLLPHLLRHIDLLTHVVVELQTDSLQQTLLQLLYGELRDIQIHEHVFGLRKRS